MEGVPEPHKVEEERAVIRRGREIRVERPADLEARYAGRTFDLLMLTLFGRGRVRTEAEFRALFAAGGMNLTRVIPTESAVNPMSILEGVPA